RDKAEAELAESRARIVDLKNKLNGNDAELTKNLTKAEKAHTDALRKQEDLAKKLETAAQRNAELEKSLAEQRKLATEWTKKSGAWEKSRSQLEEKLEKAQTTAKGLEDQVRDREARLQSEQSERNQQISQASERIHAIESELHQSASQISQLEGEIRNHQEALTSAHAAREEASRQVTELRAELDHAQSARTAAESNLASHDESVALILTERDQIRAKFNELLAAHGDLEEIQAKKESLSKSIASDQDRQDAASNRLADLQAQIGKSVRRLEDIQSELKEVESKAKERREELDKNEQALNSRRKELDQAISELNELKGERKQRELNGDESAADGDNLRSKIEAFTARLTSQSVETETKKALKAQLAEAEKRLADVEHREAMLIEREKAFATQSSRVQSPAEHAAETARLEALREKVAEFESYQKILKESLRLDQATVQIFSQQMIRKLDHIEDMIDAFRNKGELKFVDQLEALKESFLDLLRDNSVRTYHFDPGTELNLDHRRMIQIVESRQAGTSAGPPRIFATVRPGYVCADAESGNERILRKAEVITHG
ncbi:MAG: hypothetical protein KDL87_14680, partial [Verrucomicrobiae bacterium]|nr:hypothetical protein [Verrucomicrobiae bacterium]